MLKNISLVLFVALVAAGCAPKSTRKPIQPGGTQSNQTAGNQGGNGNVGKPEPREQTQNTDTSRQNPQTQPSATPQTRPPTTPSATPQTQPSTTPSATPQTRPSTTPSTTPPSTTPSTTPPSPTPTVTQQQQVGPPTREQVQGQNPKLQQGIGQVPPAQALAQIAAPTSPAPELESKPGLVKTLWMRLHGDGQGFEAEMNIVASPPIKQDRIKGEKEPNARFLFAEFDINNQHNRTTKGTFEFRHPSHGAIEKFNVTNAATETATEDLKNATDANKHTPKPFEIHIRVPIDDVTQDMLFTIADGFRDFARRDAQVAQQSQAAQNGNQPAANAGDLEKVQAELKRLEEWITVIDGTDEEKRLDSKIRLGINKDRLAELILKPAFSKWKEVFYEDECVEVVPDPAKPDDFSKSNPPNCHGEFWLHNRQKKDIKEFNKYLDKKENVERLVNEYLTATAQVKAEKRRQVLVSQPAQVGGAVPPMAPPPPAPSTALDFAIGEVKILKTNGEPSGGALTQPNRIKLVFVGDAFTKELGPTFYVEAQKKWDYLFGSTAANQPGIEPFRTYRKYFMGIAISTESKDGRSCHPSQSHDCRTGTSRSVSTALESQFDNFGIQRLLGMSKEGYRKLGNLLRANVPDFDLASVIVNDPEYGGAGGTYALVSLDPNANEVIAHELMGHSFAKLGDEYTDPYPSFPDTEEANTMKDSTKAEGKKWASHMFKNKSDLVTTAPDESELIQEVVQGSHYHSDGWWRPFRMCKMKSLGKPFCSVCRDSIIQKIYNKIKPIDTITTTPALNDKGALAAKASDAWELKITTLQPEQPTTANASTPLLKIQWSVGSTDCEHATPIAGATNDTLTAAIAKLNPGNYKVCAKVSDTNIDVTRLNLDLGTPSPLEQVRAFDVRIN